MLASISIIGKPLLRRLPTRRYILVDSIGRPVFSVELERSRFRPDIFAGVRPYVKKQIENGHCGFERAVELRILWIVIKHELDANASCDEFIQFHVVTRRRPGDVMARAY